MPLFSFNLDSFQIVNTRSAHTDTDYACVTVKTSTLPNNVHTQMSQNLGNLNNGTFHIGLSCAGLTIYPDSPVVFNYLIFNSGTFTEGAVSNMLTQIGTDLVNGPALSSGSALIYVQNQYASQLALITKAGSCDGLVAAEQISFTYEQMIGLISSSYSYAGPPTVHNGGFNPKGCNSKPSQYIANWSMGEVVSISSILNEKLATAEQTLTGLQLTSKVVSGPNSATAFVKSANTLYPVLHSQVQLTTTLTLQ
jgi:hypothetical protein